MAVIAMVAGLEGRACRASQQRGSFGEHSAGSTVSLALLLKAVLTTVGNHLLQPVATESVRRLGKGPYQPWADCLPPWREVLLPTAKTTTHFQLNFRRSYS
jgi:hypothetical protein